MEYKTKQVGWVILIIVNVVLVGMTYFLWSLRESDPKATLMMLITGSVFIFLMFLFGTLETTVSKTQIIIKFGIGLIKRKINLSDISKTSQVKNKFWYGWGIRLTPHGWLWNIAGYEAVEIEFKSGKKKFRIGCKSSKELQKEIQKRLKK